MNMKAIADKASAGIEKLLPVVVHIQANLDQDLSLEALAKRARLSTYHFHRLFRSAVGETLKQYTGRGAFQGAAEQALATGASIRISRENSNVGYGTEKLGAKTALVIL